MRFLNRQEAGKHLAAKLQVFKGNNSLVLALPRGGVVIGREISDILNLPLGLVIVKKLSHPLYPEYAIGAVAEKDKPIYSSSDVAEINSSWLKTAEELAYKLIEYRRQLYYGKDFVLPNVKGKTIILVDDGLATGLTMKAAIMHIRKLEPNQIIVAVPVASLSSMSLIKSLSDRIVSLDDPSNFLGTVGSHYQQFEQVTDKEVKQLLRRS